MINLLRLICAIGFCSILVLSCKKNKEEKNYYSCDQIVKVVYTYNGNHITIADIKYDEQGRVKSVKGDGKSFLAYAYYKDSIMLQATDYSGFNIGLIYYLDAKGRIKGTSLFDNQYTYNDEGYLISFRQPIANATQITGYDLYTLKYENGDLVEMTSPTSENLSKVNFKYYDEPNQEMAGFHQPLYMMLGNRDSYYLTGAGFFGKQSAHLYKNYAIKDVWATDIYYSKDAKGRITSSGVYSLEYPCQ